MKKIAFVSPWYGRDIPGGAEMELRSLIQHLDGTGVEVEVLTTCAKEFASYWYRDYHKAGAAVEDGIMVRRFKLREGDGALFNQINFKVLKGAVITDQEEEDFLTNIVNSDDLYSYMKEHEEEYALFLFIPYMFGITYHGALVCPRKSVLIPCLHDEGYAYFKRFRRCFSRVNGMIFNAEPERELANRLYYLKHVNQITMGIGMDTDIHGDGDRFRAKYGIKEPFILYAGRKDHAKNVDTLVSYFARYKQEYQDGLALVMIGPGEVPIPESAASDVHDLGFVPVQDKHDAYAAANLLCQPSKHESFSFVIMESWLMGRPVLVHEGCKVTSNFVRESDGGFDFADYPQFAAEVEYLLGHPQIADTMGRQGRTYVQEHFAWDVVMQKFLDFLKLCAKQAEDM